MNIVPVIVAIVVPLIAFFGVVYGTLWQRVTAVEIRADKLQEALELSQKEAIAAKQAESNARNDAVQATERAVIAETKVAMLDERVGRLEDAFDYILQSPAIPDSEKKKIGTLYHPPGRSRPRRAVQEMAAA